MKKIVKVGVICLYTNNTYEFTTEALEDSVFAGAFRLIPVVLDVAKLNPSLDSLVLPLSPNLSLEFGIVNFDSVSDDSNSDDSNN